MTRLSVNLNKIALLRNSRGRDYPNVLLFAERCIKCGGKGITVHPRQDQRHTRYSDVYDLSAFLRDRPDVEFNVEGCPIPELLEIVKEIKPDQCTLVPDAVDQITSDHGWNLDQDGDRLMPIIRDLQEHGIRVSLFVDPDLKQIRKAKEIGTDRIELYTESYARAYDSEDRDDVLSRFRVAAGKAQLLGLGVNAGHDLNLRNLRMFLTIDDILEVSIGHAIIMESLDYGWEETIKRYLEIIQTP